MKRSVLLVIGIGLVGAAPPAHQSFGWSAPEAKGGYPPCSKTVTDRCIQLYERGVATETNLALNRRLGSGAELAMGGPIEPLPYDRKAMTSVAPRAASGDYPPCTRLITDRCIQLYERGVRAKGERG